MLIPKNPRLEDPNHLAFVKTLPCVITGQTPSDPSHISKGSGRGTGYKADDNRVVPLSRKEHATQHSRGEISYWYPYGGWEFALKLAYKLHENTGRYDECHELIRMFRRKEWSLQL